MGHPSEGDEERHAAFARLEAARGRAAERLRGASASEGTEWLQLERRYREHCQQFSSLATNGPQVGSGLLEHLTGLATFLADAFDRFRPSR
jgi:hypothetical protein